ncbi:hypothetical protein HDU67_000357 [Dinochytrium kinnereticum]|nr:hypothetical protein HDU67_000357 [Dinochytrium kinnereticum]
MLSGTKATGSRSAGNPNMTEFYLKGQLPPYSSEYNLMALDIPIYEVHSGSIVASTTEVKPGDGASPIYRYNESTDPFITDFSSWASKNFDGNLTAIAHAAKFGLKNLLFFTVIKEIEHSVAVTSFSPVVGGLYPWLLIEYSSVQGYRDELESRSKDVQKFLFPVMAVLVIVGTFFAWLVSRQILLTAKELFLLRDFDFKSILTPRRPVDRVLIIYEFVDMQESFHQMVAKLLEMSRGYAYTKGKSLIISVHTVAQKEINDRIQHDIEDFLTNVELVLSYQVSQWALGTWNVSRSDVPLMGMRNQMLAFRNFISGTFFVPMRTGVRQGFYYEPGSNSISEWRQGVVGSINMTEDLLSRIGSDTSGFSWDQRNIFDVPPISQNNSYIRLSFISFVRTPENEMIIVGTDLTNEIFQSKLRKVVSSIGFPLVIAIIDVNTGGIISTNFSSFVNREFKGNLTAVWKKSGDTHSAFQFKSNLRSYSAEVGAVHSEQNTTHPWIILKYVNEDAVNFDYLSASKKTQRVVNNLKIIRDLRLRVYDLAFLSRSSI